MSANIKLEYWGAMARISGKSGEAISAGSLRDVIRYIRSQYGREGMKQAKRMIIAVNDTNIHLLRRYKTALADGDTVAFFPLSAGG